jgi:hypothetical protein
MALDFDTLQHALVLSVGRQYSRNAVKYRQVGIPNV